MDYPSLDRHRLLQGTLYALELGLLPLIGAISIPTLFNCWLLISRISPRWFYSTENLETFSFRRRLRILLILAPLLNLITVLVLKLSTSLALSKCVNRCSVVTVACQIAVALVPLLLASAKWIMAYANAIDIWCGAGFGPEPDAARVHALSEALQELIEERRETQERGEMQDLVARVVHGDQQVQQPPPPPYVQ
ncbi:hypothetical protein HII31_06807 [Pseudocercospora fuligena]|uniref:Uncharacterized protein n=1 Tax=Pseudocercospora fuligena TaxID=685502 RepID=A0A8H6RJ23_9PEZI|nr:hypothetical protein HII31_06807 [Pseudocercospora fuligena]